jgi:hypothetical protein
MLISDTTVWVGVCQVNCCSLSFAHCNLMLFFSFSSLYVLSWGTFTGYSQGLLILESPSFTRTQAPTQSESVVCCLCCVCCRPGVVSPPAPPPPIISAPSSRRGFILRYGHLDRPRDRPPPRVLLTSRSATCERKHTHCHSLLFPTSLHPTVYYSLQDCLPRVQCSLPHFILLPVRSSAPHHACAFCVCVLVATNCGCIQRCMLSLTALSLCTCRVLVLNRPMKLGGVFGPRIPIVNPTLGDHDVFPEAGAVAPLDGRK